MVIFYVLCFLNFFFEMAREEEKPELPIRKKTQKWMLQVNGAIFLNQFLAETGCGKSQDEARCEKEGAQADEPQEEKTPHEARSHEMKGAVGGGPEFPQVGGPEGVKLGNDPLSHIPRVAPDPENWKII